MKRPTRPILAESVSELQYVEHRFVTLNVSDKGTTIMEHKTQSTRRRAKQKSESKAIAKHPLNSPADERNLQTQVPPSQPTDEAGRLPGKMPVEDRGRAGRRDAGALDQETLSQDAPYNKTYGVAPKTGE
jgi:hypothetical protein